MTLKEAPALLAERYASSSGVTSPGFTELPSCRFPPKRGEIAWLAVEDAVRHDAYWWWIATVLAQSTSVQSVPDWGTVLFLSVERGVESFLPPEQLNLISKTFSLSKVELARTLGVSRQTIYEWLAGRPVSAENEERLLRLARLAWDFGGQEGQSLLRRFVAEAASEGEPSILEMLFDSPWNEPKLRRALGEAQARTVRRKSGSASSWLRSLGFREPDSSERAANLGYNVFLDDIKRS
jgi:DNA-binding transcriptional regulator YiaG